MAAGGRARADAAAAGGARRHHPHDAACPVGSGVEALAREQLVHDAATGAPGPIVGRVVARGLADELRDRHYLIVDGTDGRSHFVDIGKGDAIEPLPAGAVVRITSRPAEVRDVDRRIAAIADANGGRYSADLHLAHDPTATCAFVEAHVRRLEAIRRSLGGVERHEDGSWSICTDYPCGRRGL